MYVEILKENPEILIGKTVRKTYQVLKVLGRGTFSVVYQCVNIETKEKFALKIAVTKQGDRMLHTEKKVYRLLSAMYGNDGPETAFAKYYEYAKTDKFNFIVLERLSASIEDIFVKLGHKFSVKTVLNIGLQALDLLEKLHRLGFVHRDVKPANFLLGHGNRKDRLYLIDFGLARKLTQQRPSSTDPKKKFIGTKRFASVAAHQGLEQSRKDDLQSLVYTLVFLLKGRLPWQGLKHSNRAQKYDSVCTIKREVSLSEFCRLEVKDQISYSGEVLAKMLKYTRALNAGDAPNYDYLRKMFAEEIAVIERKSIPSGASRWRCQGKFDWMDEAESEKYGRDDRHSREDRHSGSRDNRRNRSREDERDSRDSRDKKRSQSVKSNHRDRYMK